MTVQHDARSKVQVVDDDVVAGLQIEAAGDDVLGVARPREKRYLFLSHPDGGNPLGGIYASLY